MPAKLQGGDSGSTSIGANLERLAPYSRARSETITAPWGRGSEWFGYRAAILRAIPLLVIVMMMVMIAFICVSAGSADGAADQGACASSRQTTD